METKMKKEKKKVVLAQPQVLSIEHEFNNELKYQKNKEHLVLDIN